MHDKHWDLEDLRKAGELIIAAEEKRLRAILDEHKRKRFEEARNIFLQAQEEAVAGYVAEMAKLETKLEEGFPVQLIEAARVSVKNQFDMRTEANRSMLEQFAI